jgi:predicted transposase YdaD
MIIAGVICAADKFIDQNYAERVKRRISMTQVGRLFEQEKEEYAKKYAKEYAKEIAQSMLQAGMDILDVMKHTHLKRAELKAIQKSIPAH